ncbi:outer membrane protein assembly factor BamB family protein [Nocardiopsis potens]|uniref:outer membrane protein assembly factor BamB family protein n=1 Tax=Nocardiopsis potens TaxID=1246458 RepID=UPI00034BE0B4|nr:PQQ-binding-like beta-propeller repeat protein [Nocardiopsis potens]
MAEDPGTGPGRRSGSAAGRLRRLLLRKAREADSRRGKRRDLRSRRASEAQRAIAEALLAERSGGGPRIARDEWGVPLDDRHVRSSLTVEGAGSLKHVLSGPRRSDFARMFRWKRNRALLAVVLLALPFLVYIAASERLSAWSDPPLGISSEEGAVLGPLWAASPDTAFAFRPRGGRTFPSRFEDTVASWPAGDSVVRADRAGATAYGTADGGTVWRTAPGGAGLCAAAADPADGGVGVVVVERDGGDGEDVRGCDTVLGIDLATGAELWESPLPGPTGAGAEATAGPVIAWSTGPHAVIARGPLLAGFDAGSGEELWSGTECTFARHRPLSRGDGSAAVLGSCGPREEAVFTGVLDTATGEVSERRALPEDAVRSGPGALTLVAADPVTVHSDPLPAGSEYLLSEGRVPEGDELLVAADGGWTRIDAEGTAGVGSAEEAWRLDPRRSRPTASDGVLYIETDDPGGNRVLAFDLERGEVRWNRLVAEDHFVRVAGAGGGRVLAVSRDPGSGGEDGAPPRTRILALPADGEGPAELVADGLPDVPWLETTPVRLHESGDRYVVGPAPDPYGKEPVPPLFAAG